MKDKQIIEPDSEIKKDFKLFIDYLTLKELSDSTIKQYEIFYRIFPQNELTQDTVKKFLLEHRGSVSRAFLRNYLDFKQRYDIKIPVRSGRKKKRLPEKISEEEIAKLRNALYNVDTKLGLMFDLTKDGALRKAEVVSLKPSCFNWDEWSKDTSKPIRCKVIGKGNKERLVIISSETAQRLKDYLKPLLRDYTVQMNTRIFNIGVRRWWEVLKIASEMILGRRIRTHSIRHNTATGMYESGDFDLLDIQRYLGH